jgi:hypothetical protein
MVGVFFKGPEGKFRGEVGTAATVDFAAKTRFDDSKKGG